MKYLKLLSGLLLLIAALNAMSIRLMGGAGLPIGKTQMDVTDVIIDGSGQTNSADGLYSSAGAGIPVLVDVSINMFEKFNIVLGAGYSIGVKGNAGNLSNAVEFTTYTREGKASHIPINLGMELETRTRVNLFIGFGGVLPLAARSWAYENREQAGEEIQSTWKTTYYPGFGFYGNIGVEFGFNRKMSFFMSAKSTLLTLRRKQSTAEEWIRDGIARDLNLLPANVRERNYGPYDPSVENWAGPSQSDSFSTVTFNLGVRLKL